MDKKLRDLMESLPQHDGREAMSQLFNGSMKPSHEELPLPERLGELVRSMNSIKEESGISPKIFHGDNYYLPSSTHELLSLISKYVDDIMDEETEGWEFVSLSLAYDICQVALRLLILNLFYPDDHRTAFRIISTIQYDI